MRVCALLMVGLLAVTGCSGQSSSDGAAQEGTVDVSGATSPDGVRAGGEIVNMFIDLTISGGSSNYTQLPSTDSAGKPECEGKGGQAYLRKGSKLTVIADGQVVQEPVIEANGRDFGTGCDVRLNLSVPSGYDAYGIYFNGQEITTLPGEVVFQGGSGMVSAPNLS